MLQVRRCRSGVGGVVVGGVMVGGVGVSSFDGKRCQPAPAIGNRFTPPAETRVHDCDDPCGFRRLSPGLSHFLRSPESWEAQEPCGRPGNPARVLAFAWQSSRSRTESLGKRHPPAANSPAEGGENRGTPQRRSIREQRGTVLSRKPSRLFSGLLRTPPTAAKHAFFCEGGCPRTERRWLPAPP